jgi:N-acetylglutamate synthase-like GNAT family acetyltransferase
MTLAWVAEQPPVWDATKAAVLGAAPPGVFDLASYAAGDLLPGEWWRVERDGQVIGYGWMDTVWGDAEILLAVEPASQRSGAGSFILDRLHEEARSRGVNYLFNEVPAAHPSPEALASWLRRRGFAPSGDSRLLRASVRRTREAAG